MPTRRAWLATLGGVATLGGGVWWLGESQAGHTLATGDAWAERGQERTATTRTLRATVELAAGEFIGHRVQPQRGVRLSVAVDADAPLDVWTLERVAVDDYRDGKRDTIMLSQVSQSGLRDGTVSGTVAAGNYVVMFDNTPRFGVAPDGPVAADVTITVAVP